MLADLDQTIQNLLKGELPIKQGAIDVKFEQPRREWSARLSKPTINLFLYDVRENMKLRRQGIQHRMMHGTNTVSAKRTPFRLDCAYMMTTWAIKSADEHNLLGSCLATLLRLPEIPEKYTVGTLRDQPFSIIGTFAAPSSLPNPNEMWSVLDNEMRPTIPYIVTIALDPWSPELERIVQTMSFTVDAPSLDLSSGDGAERITIGGMLLSAETGEPLTQTTIALKNSGFTSISDDAGRYRLQGLRHGTNELVIWHNDRLINQTIHVPSSHYNVSL